MNSQEINNSSKKTTFITRTKTTCYLVCFYFVVFLLSFFSDPRNTFFENVGKSYLIHLICFSCLFFILFAFVITSSIYEWTKCFFGNRKKIFGISLLLSLAFLFSTSAFLGLFQFQIVNDVYLIKFGYLPTVFFFPVLLIIIELIFYKFLKNRFFNKKSTFHCCMIYWLINFFGIAFLFGVLVCGWITCLLILLISCLSDVFAYLCGTLLGKHKMCPKISPKKTWEGTICSVSITSLIMFGLYYLIMYIDVDLINRFIGFQFALAIKETKYWPIILLGVTMVLIIVSMLGDLYYSKIKRIYQIKDFGNCLPGHGGVLDRLDALSFIYSFYFTITICSCTVIACVRNNFDFTF